MKAKINKVTIQILDDSPYDLNVSGLVVVTDPNLSIDPAMSQHAGPAIEQECFEIGWCDIGSAVITTAGNLPFDRVIHAVAPRWGEGGERGKLSKLTVKCLELAEENRLKSIALPAISTGTLGYPIESSARIMLEAIVDYTFEELQHLRTVYLCLDSAIALEVFDDTFGRMVRELQSSGEAKVKV